MKALDFEYDGLNLSDFGCMICTFDSTGTENITMGSVITFNTTYVNGNNQFLLSNISYETCLETEFDICKNTCDIFNVANLRFSVEEQRQIMRWLNRGEYLKLKFLDDGYENIYYEGSFYNIEKIEIAGEVVGFHLYLTTNSPFAFHDAEIFSFDIVSNNGSYIISDISDKIGYTYADLKITCKQSGDLRITNSMDNRTLEIKNCSEGETITIKNMIIESSLQEHQNDLMNDFNFSFIRISNKFDKRENCLTFSIPCSVTLKYIPTLKVGI